MQVKLRSKMSHWPKIPHRYDLTFFDPLAGQDIYLLRIWTIPYGNLEMRKLFRIFRLVSVWTPGQLNGWEGMTRSVCHSRSLIGTCLTCRNSFILGASHKHLQSCVFHWGTTYQLCRGQRKNQMPWPPQKPHLPWQLISWLASIFRCEFLKF